MSLPILKVLYIAHISSKYTGANRSMLNMISGLQKVNVQPIVILPPMEDMSLKNELDSLGIENHVVKYFMPVYGPTKTLGAKIKFLPKLIRAKTVNYLAKQKIAKLAKHRQINIIHTNVGPLLLGADVAKQLYLPHFWHLREFQDLDFNFHTWYTKEGFKKLLSQQNTFPVAISKAVFDHFELQHPARTIYNGILKTAEAQFLPDKLPYFLFVGYLSENKGIRVLINSFAQLSKLNKDYKLLIAGETGDSEYLSELKDLVKHHSIEDKIEFLGHRDDIPDIMAKASALVVPSLNEAFGRITAEAMFNGCLVIGKNTGGTKEIIDMIGIGMLYDTDDELLTAMQNVTERGIEPYYNDLKIALAKAVDNFSEERNAEYIYDYYQIALGNNKDFKSN